MRRLVEEEEVERKGGRVRRLSKESADRLRSSLLDCTQTFVSVVRALVETILDSCCVQPPPPAAASADTEGERRQVKVLLDCSELTCRVQSEGFGADPELVLRDETFKVLTQFATISLVTRPRGALETREFLWKQGKLVSSGQSKVVLHSYSSWFVVKDLLCNIPVRRNMLVRTRDQRHTVLLRNELFPAVVSSRHVSFEFATWPDSRKIFASQAMCPLPVVLVNTFEIERKNLLQISVKTPEETKLSLYYLKDWRHQQQVLFEHVLLDGKVATFEAIASTLKHAAGNLFREELDGRSRRRSNPSFSFLLDIRHSNDKSRKSSGSKEARQLGDIDGGGEALDRLIQTLLSFERKKTTKATKGMTCQKLPFKIVKNSSHLKKHRGLEEGFPSFPLRGHSAFQCMGCCVEGCGQQGLAPAYEMEEVDGDADPKLSVSKVRDLAFLGKNLLPGKISREMIGRCSCLGQVDKKFVAAVTGSTLLLFDQHAADERLILDHLTLKTTENLKNGLNSFECVAPMAFQATIEERYTVDSYANRLREWGWEASYCTTSKRMLVTRIPCIDGRKLTLLDLRDYLHQLQITCGSKSMPKAITYVLGSRACKRAVKFGDSLTMNQCKALVDGMRETRMPFQCAHGRPTCVPLVDMAKLAQLEQVLQKKRKRTFDFERLRKKEREERDEGM